LPTALILFIAPQDAAAHASYLVHHLTYGSSHGQVEVYFNYDDGIDAHEIVSVVVCRNGEEIARSDRGKSAYLLRHGDTIECVVKFDMLRPLPSVFQVDVATGDARITGILRDGAWCLVRASITEYGFF
jgi:hypothetical protein